ncbi:MAG: type II toxin-antitoxin system ParD family antitoxin [Oculatellaceae cyanobacterium Prado106]|jgi:antitoxin ParD1/3/4|nr:type II toxin-antitoxin system ParD family antitoxin [Oculatellaceae cyanobacterium Prado106]
MQVNILLPEEVQNYVLEQVAIGGYETAAEYFLALVQQDRQRRAQEQLEAMLMEGIESEGQEVTPEFWQQMRNSVLGQGAFEDSEDSAT